MIIKIKNVITLASAIIILVGASTIAQLTQVGNGLTVTITGIKSYEGELLVSVFSSEEKFLEDPVEHLQIALEKGAGEQVVTIENLEAGTYAVSIIHDHNLDGKLTMGSFGPKEPYGFSNDAKGFMGPPDYEECTFEYDGKALHLKIKLR